MPKRKVLVIGMLDSIHLARWIKQFADTDFDLILFPSTHFRFVHKRLVDQDATNIKIWGLFVRRGFSGYIDSLMTLRFLGNFCAKRLRRIYLQLLIAVYRPDVIHAIEIQHAGYLVSSLSGAANQRILTNWGSDIYFYHHLEDHEVRIRKALKWATHYSAECARDYSLARQLGFKGIELPKIPNAGGFETFEAGALQMDQRDQLIVKCYGGKFGLGLMSLEICTKFLATTSNTKVFLYSVTEDLLEGITALTAKFPGRIRYSTLSHPLSHEAILVEFMRSRVYLGMSRSDGLSTSFLEAIASGTYPIQTNTSCASEIVDLGAVGSIVIPDSNLVFELLLKVYFDDDLLGKASKQNFKIARDFLDYSKIQGIALSFYDLA